MPAQPPVSRDDVSIAAPLAVADLQPTATATAADQPAPIIQTVTPARETLPKTEPNVVSPIVPAADPVLDAPTAQEIPTQTPAQAVAPQATFASGPSSSSPPPSAAVSTNTPVVDLKAVVTSAAADTLPANDLATARPQPEPVAPAQPARSESETVSASPAAAIEPLMASSPASGDDLPPLPPDLSRPAPVAASADRSTPQPPAVAATVGDPKTSSSDDLPPLPADLGRSDTATTPTVGTHTINSPTPASAMTEREHVQPSQDVGTAPAHSEQESAIPLGVGSELPVAPPATNGETRPTDVGAAPTAHQAAAASPLPTIPETNVASEPAATAPSSIPPDRTSAAPAPVAQPYPATNPNLQLQPATIAEAADGSSLPAAIPDRPAAPSSDLYIPNRPTSPSSLRPDLMREVEQIARNQEDELRRQAQNPPQPAAQPRDTTIASSDLRTQTQLDISRAPSPAEARPIKAIPVPEDWVPLPPRNWTPQRKYWAAAATCHLPLYFQDPVLERYGHSVEQFVGPLGRFLTYPLDDPTQSTQRNQMIQPFFSAGLMGLQIIAWPYNLIMDPPWEAQYDLGYYRPGDNIPTDTYWLPLHGYGPPLRGNSY